MGSYLRFAKTLRGPTKHSVLRFSIILTLPLSSTMSLSNSDIVLGMIAVLCPPLAIMYVFFESFSHFSFLLADIT